MMLWC